MTKVAQNAAQVKGRGSVPNWVHHELYAGDVVKVLHISYNKLDRLTRKGVIPLTNTDWRNQNEWRAYDPEAIAKYARSRNITPDWKAIKEK